MGDAVRCNVEMASPNLKSNPKAKGCHSPRGEVSYLVECCKALCKLPGSSDLS